MSQRPIKRALLSVYDKTGIVDFARALVDEFGIEIISTGGTASLLKENGIPVTLVEQITGFPEMLDGRVKTLHPKIHAAILADRDNPEHMRQLKEQGIEPIDMVVVNLYPFEKTVADPNCTFEQAIEMIDIGGPCLLRAAAKNHEHVLPIPLGTTSSGFAPDWILSLMRGETNKSIDQERIHFSSTALAITAGYDGEISTWLSRQPSGKPDLRFLRLVRLRELRYGENPLQSASCYLTQGGFTTQGLAYAGTRTDVNMSYNNLCDANAAVGLCGELGRANYTCCVLIKHTNPCGVGISADPFSAYQGAYLGDPAAAMGGILACSFEVEAEFAAEVMETYDRLGKRLGDADARHAPGGFFLEVWVAPEFDDKAVGVIRTRKKWGENVRLLAVGRMTEPPHRTELQYRSIAGGMLVQTPDTVGLNEDQWKVVTKRSPSEVEMQDIRLAWLIAKHTKSNAITICKDGMLIGNGAGQMSRVMSCRIATWLAKENGHEDKLKGAAAASDAFFPFSDGPNILMDAGVTAIIQPGGSKRDKDTIAACDERGVAMILTGTRHFKH